MGDNNFSATFTPEDTENYSSVTATLTISVTKAGTSSAELADDEKPKAVENLIEEPFEQVLVTAPEKLPEGYTGVYIGETEMQKDVDYIVKKSSTVVTILPAAFDKLDAGEYTLTVRFTNGEASTKLIVIAANSGDPTSPQTGDNSRIELWIILMTVSAIAATSLFLIGRRKKVFGK